MKSKNSLSFTPQEEAHLAAVKSQACSFCDADPPSIAHHITQGDHFTTVATCDTCHVGAGGIHRGGYSLPYSEQVALNITLARIAGSKLRVDRERSQAATRTPNKIVARTWV